MYKYITLLLASSTRALLALVVYLYSVVGWVTEVARPLQHSVANLTSNITRMIHRNVQCSFPRGLMV